MNVVKWSSDIILIIRKYVIGENETVVLFLLEGEGSRREEMFPRETRPLKRPRLGVPDFYPQENKQREVRSHLFQTNTAQFSRKFERHERFFAG